MPSGFDPMGGTRLSEKIMRKENWPTIEQVGGMSVDLYGWIKAFHIIAVIAWMAGMLYLPRLFVYHCAAEKGSVQSASCLRASGRRRADQLHALAD